jgi:periplasmic copper chaperone A
MTLHSREGVTLTGVSAPAGVGVAELHEMKMEGDVMRMRAITTLRVPSGQAVELKPGGHHLMLVGLKAPLLKGVQVPVTFHFRDAKGAKGQVEVKIPVMSAAPMPSTAEPAAAGHRH